MHRNFKNLDQRGEDAKAMMDSFIRDVFDGSDLERKTTLWERNDWKQDELDNFEIDLEKIDRLYYIDTYHETRWDTVYYLVCRMDYNGKSVYIELKYNLKFKHQSGIILISADVNRFIESILSKTDPTRRICQSLADDGIEIYNYIYDYEKYYRDIIQANNELFDVKLGDFKPEKIIEFIFYYRNSLPNFLQNNFIDFIDFVENKLQLGDW